MHVRGVNRMRPASQALARRMRLDPEEQPATDEDEFGRRDHPYGSHTLQCRARICRLPPLPKSVGDLGLLACLAWVPALLPVRVPRAVP